MEITNGRVRIQASRSLKVPTNVAFSSTDATVGISIEFDAEGDLAEIKDQALVEQARLGADVLLSLATQLGVELVEVDGVLAPVVKPGPEKPATPKRNYGGGGGGSSSGGGYSGNSGGRVYNDPTFPFEWNGETFQVKDQRSLKASGKFKDTAPDFKLVDGVINGRDGIYLVNKDGSYSKVGLAIAEAIDGAA